jgi:hypothetical protein
MATLEEVVRSLIAGAEKAAAEEQARAASEPKMSVWERVRRLHAGPRVEADDDGQPT